MGRFLRPAAAIVILTLGSACQSEKPEKSLRRQLTRELHNHSFESAAPLARRLVQLAPQDNVSWKRLIESLVRLHDVEGATQALTAWRTAARLPIPRMDECEGDIAREARDWPKAIAAWQRATVAEPKRHRAFGKLAAAYQSQQRWTEAIEGWTGSLKAKDTAHALINRAACKRRLHLWTEAFEDWRRAQKLEADDPEVRQWSKMFENLAKFMDQINDLNARIAALPGDVGLLGDRALLFLRCGDAGMALDDCEQAMRIAPWAMRPRLCRGLALIALRRGKELDQLSIRQPLRLDLLSPDIMETIARLDSAISVEPRNADNFAMRAWHLNEIGQPGLALEDTETAARLDPRSGGAAAEAAYALTKLGRPNEAFEKIKTATALDPTLATAWQYRGELEMNRGNNLAAIDSLSRALKLQQTVAALQKREECYRRAGLPAQAEEDRRTLQRLTAQQDTTESKH